MTPFASVMEWNVCCLYLIQALFVADGFAGYTPAGLLTAVGATPPVFLAWLLFVLLAVPLYGQLFPKEVPFLVAFRPCKKKKKKKKKNWRSPCCILFLR